MSAVKTDEKVPEYPDSFTNDPDAGNEKVGVEDSVVTPSGDEEAPLTTEERLAKLEGEHVKLQENYTNVKTAMKQERSKRQAESAAHKRELLALKEKQAEEEILGDAEDDEPLSVGDFKKTAETKRGISDEQMLNRDLTIGTELSRAKHDDFEEVVGPHMDELEARMSSDPAYVQQILAGDTDPINFAEHVYQTLKERKQAPVTPAEGEPAGKVVEKVTNPVIGPKTMNVEKRPAKSGTKVDLTDLETVRSLMKQGKITQEDLDSRW